MNGWDDYYPEDDNTLAVFTDLDRAEKWLLQYLKTTKYKKDRYEIFEMEIEE